MKTKIRTFITVCTFAFAGVLNANATVNFEEKNSGLNRTNESLTVWNEKTTSFESGLNESIDYGKEAQIMLKSIADQEEAKAVLNVMERGFVAPIATSNSAENEAGTENNFETTDFRKEAQIILKSIADQEEAKAVLNVMERGFVAPNETVSSSENEAGTENNFATTDFRKEAQLILKSIADQEEAKAVLNVMERGFVAPIETSNSTENEAGTENNFETTDFQKEAQLMIKLIADNEEAKAVQKVMERGFVAPIATSNSAENEAGTENNFETTDFRKEAQIILKSIADQEEAKAVLNVMERGFVAPIETSNSAENEAGTENNFETTDFRKEAQIILKSIADQEEAKAVLNVMERGFVAPIETSNSTENEAGTENNFETTDFRKEAQLLLKSIADQEEAKAVLNVMERGFVAPNETISSSENEAGTENDFETTDFRKEAQLMLKSIADQEEAKAIQKVTVEDILAENK